MAEYKKLFNTEITHSYYSNRISPDFDIVPLSGTQQWMKDNRLLFRYDNKGFRVIYRSEEGSDLPFVPFVDFDMKFAMILKNKNSFQNITDLDDSADSKDYESGNLIMFKNTVQDDVPLDYDILNALKPSSFTFKFPQSGGPGDNGEITIMNEAGADVTPSYPDPNAVTPDQNGDFFYPIDFSSLPPGQYTFTTTVNTLDPQTEELYIDNELVRKGAFGLIKIHVDDYVDFPEDRRYTADFTRRETIWRYKMVLKTITLAAGESVAIVDGDSVYTFAAQPNEVTNGILTAVFDSDAVIPYSELPRKNFDFIKNPGAEVLLTDIANPPVGLISAFKDEITTDFGKSVIYITV